MLLQLLRGSKALPIVNKLSAISLIQRDLTSTTKSPAAPKKPKNSPYYTFASHEFANYRKNDPTSRAVDIFRALRAQWNTLDSGTKQKYMDLHKTKFEMKLQTYEKERAEFWANLSDEEKEKLDRKIIQRERAALKEEIHRLECSLGKPKQPKLMVLFYNDILRSDPGLKFSVKGVASRWNNLPEEEKGKYRERYRVAKNEYGIAWEAYRTRLEQDKEARETLEKLRSKASVLGKLDRSSSATE